MLKVKMAKIRRSGFAFCGMIASVGSLALWRARGGSRRTRRKRKSPQDAWVKLCAKAPSLQEEGKEENVCLTHHERIDGNTGRVLVSAAIREVEGKDQSR